MAAVAASPVLSAALIGTRVRVTMAPEAGAAAGAAQTVFEADVFAVHDDGAVDASGARQYDERQDEGLIIFRRQHHHTWQKADYFVASRACIASVTMLGAGDALPSLRDFTPAELEGRWHKAEAAAEQKASRRGKGVSAAAQQLFDLLARNFPDIYWSERTIVVSAGRLGVEEPYAPENIVYANPGEESMLRPLRARLVDTLMAARAQLKL